MLARALLLVLLLLLAGGLFARRARLLYRLARMGRPAQRPPDIPRRVGREVVVVLGQRKLLQRLLPGLMHAFIFWGFLVLLTTIAEALGQAVDERFALPLIGRAGWLGLVQDVFAALVIVGVGMAFFIRKVLRPERFVGSHLREADFILLTILLIMLTLLGGNAVRIARGVAEAPPAWTPVSHLLSLPLEGLSPGLLRFLEIVLVWGHILLILGFLVYIPRSKHLHIVTSSINVFFRNTRPMGTLTPLRIDLEAEEVHLGTAAITDLTWKQVVDLYSCTECGRCQAMCPAWNTGKPLSPKLLVMNLRDHLFEEGPRILAARRRGEEPAPPPIVPEVVDPEVIWSCTTCGACMHECPVDIEHVDHIVDLRRFQVMGESAFPPELGQMLRGLEGAGNPWGMPQDQRADWARGLDVRILAEGDRAPEVLYWVGCAGSFDDRAKAISRAVASLLTRAGVDVAILGPRELCTGDPARRMGNEYLFQTLAERNVETLNGVGARTVLTNCPHCFNTLRNEYPDHGGRYEVVHHSTFLARLVEEGRLRPTEEVRALVAYHDPCYLGRHNGVYDEPRRVLDAIPGLDRVELPRHRERGFCCGAGGARMWMEEPIGRRVNRERMDEVASTRASALGVACPYCLVMLDDGAKDRGDEVEVVDLAQLLARAVGDGGPDRSATLAPPPDGSP